jgi:hypothetical protein
MMRYKWTFFLSFASLSFVIAQASPDAFAQNVSHVATPQRPTFTSDTSTTAPGTMEIEFGAAATGSSGGFLALPTMIKYTPDVGGGILHQAEFSLSFDALERNFSGPDTPNRFGRSLLLIVRRPIWAGDRFSLAIAPQALFFLREIDGARVGLTGLVAFSDGPNTVVTNLTWTVATDASTTNPTRKYDVALDYGRALGTSGRFAVFAGVLTEKPSSSAVVVSMSQGLTYRMRPNLVWDVAIAEEGFGAGPSGYKILGGVTVNVGRLR